MRVKLIQDEQKFRDMRLAWNDLLGKSNTDEISLTWEWLYTWWSVFGKNRKLFIITVYSENNLIAIAPFVIREIKYLSLIKFRRIEYLGTGEDEKDEICSDYLSIIAEKDKEQSAAEAVFDFLQKNNNLWDELYFADSIEESVVFKKLLELCISNSYHTKETNRFYCPYILLPPNWETLARETKINSREQINRKINLLEKEGNVKMELIHKTSSYSDKYMQMKKLHQKRWERTDKSGCFASNIFDEFHKKIFDLLMPTGGIKLFLLKVNDNYVTCRYILAYKEKYYDYLTGVDPGYKATLSIGTLLLANCIKDAINSKMRYFDFFKGKKGSYKYKWTSQERTVITLRVLNKSIKSKIFGLVLKLKNIKMNN